FFFYTQCPKGWPKTRADRDTCPHFKTPVLPAVFASCVDRRRRVMNLLTCSCPMFAVFFVIWIRFFLLSSFDNEQAIFAVSVIFLVPLRFVISFESFFKTPVFCVDNTVVVKLIGPYQSISWVLFYLCGCTVKC